MARKSLPFNFFRQIGSQLIMLLVRKLISWKDLHNQNLSVRDTM